MTVVVTDDSVPLLNSEEGHDHQDGQEEGLTVTLFKPDPQDFPRITSIGDIIQFRHMKVWYAHKFIALKSNDPFVFKKYRFKHLKIVCKP